MYSLYVQETVPLCICCLLCFVFWRHIHLKLSTIVGKFSKVQPLFFIIKYLNSLASVVFVTCILWCLSDLCHIVSPLLTSIIYLIIWILLKLWIVFWSTIYYCQERNLVTIHDYGMLSSQLMKHGNHLTSHVLQLNISLGCFLKDSCILIVQALALFLWHRME